MSSTICLKSFFQQLYHMRVASPSFQRLTEHSNNFFQKLGTHELSTLRQLPLQDIERQLTFFACVRPPKGQLHTPEILLGVRCKMIRLLVRLVHV
jgi:hypothetical protein